jgi:hypothetical protein
VTIQSIDGRKNWAISDLKTFVEAHSNLVEWKELTPSISIDQSECCSSGHCP